MIDGRIVISEKDPRAARGYDLYGAVAQSAGLVWGGSWRSLKDLGHVELRRSGVLRGATPTRAAPP
ncbi:M15 family metallopeptidase [Pseudorhodoferax sp. Leaf267]|uniref:M15 family metallopeptidase n=1 Tax=Pseudorhodoferax sp. Leaf267 TaxID=1736316 RepID=UPI000A5C8CA3